MTSAERGRAGAIAGSARRAEPGAPARPPRRVRRRSRAARRGPWRILRLLLLALAAVWFFVEEVGWRPLARWLGQLSAWGPWARCEAWMSRLAPRPALLLFLLPMLLLLPVKLLALGLMHNGRPITGVLVIIAAKLVSTAIGGRIFLLLRPKLMQIRRFSRAISGWRLTRREVRWAFRMSLDWRALRASLRATLRRWRRRLRFRRWGRVFRARRRSRLQRQDDRVAGAKRPARPRIDPAP